MVTSPVSSAELGAAKIYLRDLGKTFLLSAGEELEAIRRVDLAVAPNEIVCVLGPSGSGKSTLLNLIAGFVAPTRGEVLIDDKRIEGPGPDRAVVFQEDSLFPWLTVAENIEYGPKALGVPSEVRRDIVDTLLQHVGLSLYKHLYPRQLSGGMKKRVDLARASANNPAVLLMDEPFGALDLPTKERMQSELISLWQREPRTIVFVTHDLEEAIFVGTRLIFLTTRPAEIAAQIEVPFEITTDQHFRTSREFQEFRRSTLDFFSRLFQDEAPEGRSR